MHDEQTIREGVAGPAPQVWSTFDSVNAVVGGALMAVDVQASEQDLNMDGKMDIIDIKVWRCRLTTA